ncbi:MAG TPA: MBL fold metallo-hydrolase [Ardenticatenaceae bacterium]|nr:MBL fold metallo-hydrolase [Ardenticatenaceae bacterium]
MAEHIHTFRLGAATVSVINLGTLRVNLAEWLRLPESAWPPRHAADLRQPLHVPMQAIHIALGDASILVDPCDVQSIAESSFAPPDYQPPPDLLHQLARLGAPPEEITHVVITHAHFDHYSGITIWDGSARRPAFPRARHFLGRADWEMSFDNLQDPASLQSRALGMVERHGLLELVESPYDAGGGVQLLPGPGETPGHLLLRLHSQGETLYCVGDLYHHPIEAEHPEWMVSWADPEANQRSRQALLEAAVREQALLIASHIPTVGRLQLAPTRITWHANLDL